VLGGTVKGLDQKIHFHIWAMFVVVTLVCLACSYTLSCMSRLP